MAAALQLSYLLQMATLQLALSYILQMVAALQVVCDVGTVWI
jgi:hypothetical protein